MDCGAGCPRTGVWGVGGWKYGSEPMVAQIGIAPALLDQSRQDGIDPRNFVVAALWRDGGIRGE